MKRNGLLFFSPSAPSRTDGAVPEGLVGGARVLAHLVLLVHLGDDDVPAAHRHDDEDDQRDLGDDVAALPQRLEAVGVVDDLGRAAAVAALAAGAAAAGRGGRRRGAAGAAVWACATATGATTAPVTAMSRTAARAAERVIFSMLSPGIGLFSRNLGPRPGRFACGRRRLDAARANAKTHWPRRGGRGQELSSEGRGFYTKPSKSPPGRRHGCCKDRSRPGRTASGAPSPSTAVSAVPPAFAAATPGPRISSGAVRDSPRESAASSRCRLRGARRLPRMQPERGKRTQASAARTGESEPPAPRIEPMTATPRPGDRP